MYDIAVIGAGPAGASAAIFAAKAGKQTVVIDNNQSITRRAWIENHYGLMAISGPDLVETGRKQAEKFGARFIQAEAQNVTQVQGGFRIDTGQGPVEAKHVILATGLSVALAEKIGLQTKPGTEPRIPKILEVDRDGRTQIPGVWAAGTVAGVSVHTIITAGDGAKVAVNVISELNGSRWVDHDVYKPANA
ncbi:MAG: FAD-dependent oxidoreductase [Alicyclobacillus sp.]|nr:FAD-dependent oxidoreductase [Alicyclobacillus sp.]